MPAINYADIVAPMVAAVAPAIEVGLACVLGYVVVVLGLRHVLRAMSIADGQERAFSAEADKYSLNKRFAGEEYDAQAEIERLDHIIDAREDGEQFEALQSDARYDEVRLWSSEHKPEFDVYSQQWIDHWNSFYVAEAVERGIPYEEAVELVDRQEQRIEAGLLVLHSGGSLDDALIAADRLGQEDDFALSGELVEVFHDLDGNEQYEYAGSIEEAVGELPTKEESKADIRRRYEAGFLPIPDGFHWNDEEGFIERDFAERVA